MIDSAGAADEVALLRDLLDAASPSDFEQLSHRIDAIEERLIASDPEVVSAIHRSSRNDRDAMAEALFPVIGAAIRKMLSEMFTFGSSQSTSSFQISHVYLVHGASGLPLAVAALPGDETTSSSRRSRHENSEEAMVAGMLDALRSFVQDAFGAEDSDGLRDLTVGDVRVLVEWGPKAVLAVVTKGVLVSPLRPQMQRILESIHVSHGPALSAFDGDASGFSDLTPLLGSLQAVVQESAAIQSQSSAVASTEAKPPSPISVLIPLLVLGFFAGLIVLVAWLLSLVL